MSGVLTQVLVQTFMPHTKQTTDVPTRLLRGSTMAVGGTQCSLERNE